MNCIKCGREIPDGELFCVDCSLTSPNSHDASPRHTSRVTRSAEREPKKAAAPSRPAGGLPAADSAPRRRPIWLVIALIVSLLLAAGAIGYLAVNYQKSEVQKANLRAREADLTLRESEADALEQQLSDVESQLNGAQNDLNTMNQTVSELRSELAGSQSSMSQAQYDMTSQQQKLETLTSENTQLLGMVDNLESQITSLNGRITTLTNSNAAYREKVDFMDSYVVFVNNDGSKFYHKYDCPDFTKKSFWAYSRKLAESNGYSACPVCGG